MESPPPTFDALADAIATRLQQHPRHCAIRFRGEDISNGCLLHASTRLATWLRAAGIVQGTRIGVCLERGPETPALLLALWWVGAAYVPLDPRLPRERLFAMCVAAQVDVIVSSPALRGVTQSLPSLLMMLETPLFEHPPDGQLQGLHRTQASDLAYILFTSGSSGTPKGVQVSHGNLAALFTGVLALLQLPPGFRVLGASSFSFDIAFFELLAPLLLGGTLVLADNTTCASPLLLAELIESEHVDVVQATPSLWQLLVTMQRPMALHTAISTGEALLRDTAAAILRHSPALWNLYGPTECTLWCTAQRVTAEDTSEAAPAVVSIGKALPGYRLQLSTTASESSGELIVGGSGVGIGYCGDHDANAGSRFGVEHGERCYYTGDLCRQDTQGRLHFLGRRDDQVKHNGYRIELDEISSQLQQHMSVRRAACLVRPATPAAPSLLFACVEFRPGLPNRNKAALNAYLANYLPAWMLPQRYFFVARLPVTASGKLDRAALLALAEPACVGFSEGSLEARVAAVFREVLDIEGIGPCDSFLDAGGSSMLAATLVLTLNERLGSELTLRQVLEAPPTVGRVVQLLQAASVNLAT